MKKALLGLSVLILVFAGACKKEAAAGGGYWTFMGDSVFVTSCVSISNYVAATNSSPSTSTFYGGLTVYFPGSSLPTTSGTYTVVDSFPTGNQLTITAYTGGPLDSAYNSIGGSGQTAYVNVTKGKIEISGTNIVLQNTTYSPAKDSITFDIHTN